MLGLGVILPHRAATGAQHDRSCHGNRHPAGPVVDIAYPKSQALSDAQRGAEEHFDDVAHLTVGLGSLDVGTGPPATGGVADCTDLLDVQRLALAFRPPQRTRPCTGFRGIASCRSANAKSWFKTVREWCARENDAALSDLRNHSTRPVVISPSEKCSNCGLTRSRRSSR